MNTPPPPAFPVRRRTPPSTFSWPRHIVSWLALGPLLVGPRGYALPTGGRVVAGSVGLSQAGASMTLTQASPNAIMNWQTFGVGAGERLRVQQGSPAAAMLARVVGNDPSKLLGSIKADGKLFLINPKGVVVGGGATIDTAAFMASTLDVSDEDFMRGGAMTFKGTSDAGLVNLGRITAREGNVMLVAHTVKNAGEINAPKGTAALAAASEVYLASPDADSVVIKFNLPKTAEKTGVENSGTIAAAQAELKAAGGSIYDLAVNQSGLVRATGIEHRNGRIVLTAAGGAVQAGGSAIARNADGTGGEILVGGSQGGKAPAVANAARTTVAASATLDAGVGGRAIVWSDDTTTFLGRIVTGGDRAGFAEVSSKSFLDYRPLSALDLGRGGKLLLDPDGIVVAAADPNISGVSWIDVNTLQGQLATTDVTLDAGDSFNFDAPVSWNSTHALTATSAGNILVNQNINAPNGTLALYAGKAAFVPDGNGDHITPQVRLSPLASITADRLVLGSNPNALPDGWTLEGNTSAADLAGNLTVGTLEVDLSNGATGVEASDGDNTIGIFRTSGTGDLTKAIVINDHGDLAVKLASANSSASEIKVTTPGALTLEAGSALSFANQTDVILASTGGAFTNQAGANAIGANGRFLIYSSSLGATTKDGLSGTNVFNHVYDANDSFADTISRFLFVSGGGPLPTLLYRADDKTRVYGDANPALTFTTTGWDNNTANDVTGAPALAVAATQSSGVGNYAITIGQGTLASSNYDFSFANGTLSVTAAPLVVTPHDASRVYGDSNPAFTASFSGLKNGDAAPAVLLNTSATSASDAGTYAISASGAQDPNYSVSYGPDATLTIDKATLNLSFTDAFSRPYGEPNANFTGLTASGLKNSDTLVGVLGNVAITTPATSASNVGTYPITISGSHPNYEIVGASGSLTVTPVALTLTADNASRLYGDANPAFTFSASGFKNSDTAALLSGVALTTTATPSSKAGAYAITTAGGSAGPNYTLSYKPGTLTVSPAPLTFAIDNQTRTYGAANPTFTTTATGFRNGETLATSGVSFSLSTAATTRSDVGTYAITGNGTAANYALNFAPGTLTIDPASLTLRPYAEHPKTYGDANPQFFFTASGFVNGDTAASSINAFGITYATPATAASSVGTYPITMSGGSAKNYRLAYEPGAFEVQRASLTVDVNDVSRVYGAANPTYTATATGLRNGDTLTSLGFDISAATPVLANTPVGSYLLAGHLRTAGNYAVQFNPGLLKITPALLTVTPFSYGFLSYGDALPTFDYALTGLVAGDTRSVLTGTQLTRYDGNALAPGDYPIAVTNPGTAANYTVVAGPAGNIEISRRSLMFIAPSFTVGSDAVPTLVPIDQPHLAPGGPQFTVEGRVSPRDTSVVEDHRAITPTIVPQGGATRADIDRYYQINVVPGKLDVELALKVQQLDLLPAFDPSTVKQATVTLADHERAADGTPWLTPFDYAKLMRDDEAWFRAQLLKDWNDSMSSDETLLATLTPAARALLERFAKGDASAWTELMTLYVTDSSLQTAMMTVIAGYGLEVLKRPDPLTQEQKWLMEALGTRVANFRADVAQDALDKYEAYQKEENERRMGENLNAMVLGARGLFGPPSDWSLKEKDIAEEAYSSVLARSLADGAAAAVGLGVGVVTELNSVSEKIFSEKTASIAKISKYLPEFFKANGIDPATMDPDQLARLEDEAVKEYRIQNVEQHGNAKPVSAIRKAFDQVTKEAAEGFDFAAARTAKAGIRAGLKVLKATGVGAIAASALEAVVEVAFVIADDVEGDKNLAKYKTALDDGRNTPKDLRQIFTDPNHLSEQDNAELMVAMMGMLTATSQGTAGLNDTYKWTAPVAPTPKG